MSMFRKATKEQSKLRLALSGPSGSGKTFTALEIAQVIATSMKKRVAAIDTERGSMSKYADRFDFDVIELTSFSPERYIEAIRDADKAGYGVLVIDSLSHAWSGKDGVLEIVDAAAAKSRTNNKFAAWREGTPEQNKLVEAVLGCGMHVIATMRTKSEWVVEKDEEGKSKPRKIGTAPVQRDQIEYEFDIAGEIDLDHQMVISKSRCHALADKVVKKPGREVAEQILAWLNTGVAPDVMRAAGVTPSDGPKAVFGKLVALWTGFAIQTPEYRSAFLDVRLIFDLPAGDVELAAVEAAQKKLIEMLEQDRRFIDEANAAKERDSQRKAAEQDKATSAPDPDADKPDASKLAKSKTRRGAMAAPTS